MDVIPFTVRLPEDLHKRASEQADREDRSLGSLVRLALDAYLPEEES